MHYSVDDCCLLYPEAEGMPLYVARIASAFADSSPDATEVHCIEVRAWPTVRAVFDNVVPEAFLAQQFTLSFLAYTATILSPCLQP